MQRKSDEFRWLAEEWAAGLASSIELMTEARPALSLGSPVPAGSLQALWFSIPLSAAENAAVVVGAAEESWTSIGKSALHAAGVTEATPADMRSTYLEIVAQATSGLAQAIAGRIGKPVSSLPAEEVASAGAANNVTPVEISLRGMPLGKLYVGWSATLEAALASPGAGPTAAERSNTDRTKQAAVEKSKTFGLLMEVELPVSISFGRAQLPLRDVLKLNSGSIVELNRTINDPVEIIVNNCVIARGEVVVVEGNYGVRIQQVISREERLRTLK